VPGAALDCIGVIVCAAKADGVQVEDFFAYGPDGNAKLLIPKLREFCDEIEPAARRPDDFLTFWLLEPSVPLHAGLYEGDGLMIHAYCRRSKDGKVRREELARFGQESGLIWERHIHSCFRVKASARLRKAV
jgi:hypothetical protein